MPNISLDKTDYRILRQLQNNGRLTNLELAERIGLSASPCLRRVRGLEDSGVIKRYVAIVDAKAVGLPTSAFINVSLRSQEVASLNAFQQSIEAFPEVMECYLMTGTSDYLLRVVVADLEAYEKFLADKLTRVPGISSIQTSFALKSVVYRTELPLT